MGFPADRKLIISRKDFLKMCAAGTAVLVPGLCSLEQIIRHPTPTPSPETSAGWVKSEFNPVLGGSLGTCFDVTVLRDGGAYRMWFSWRPPRSIALVESSDGVHWSQPLIVLAPDVTTGWEDYVNRPSVIKMDDGYQMWYTGQTDTHSWIGHATSRDGNTWIRTDQKPALSADQAWEGGAVMCPSVIYDGNSLAYRMWYSAGNQGEPLAIGYALSPDGIQWTKYSGNPIFLPDPHSSWDNNRVSACQVVLDGGWHIMFYIGFSDILHAQIGVARSRDGISGWQRHRDNPIIRPGAGEWDEDAVYKPATILEEDRWMLWYNGRRGGAEQIGLATHAGVDLGF